MKKYFAHSADKSGKWQTMQDHALNVSTMAEARASFFGMGPDAKLAGLLHDLGKYGDLFVKRLEGTESGLDHWSAGAWAALTKQQNLNVALAIQGHHVGIQKGDMKSLRDLEPSSLNVKLQKEGRKLTGSDLDTLLQRFDEDGYRLPIASPSSRILLPSSASAMLDVRMLFSTLVDADYLDTEAHFQTSRAQGLPLKPGEALELLHAHLSDLIEKSQSSDQVRSLRDDLLKACIHAGQISGTGLFTLTAPTGTGKTLAMLAYALEHAKANNLRRIVIVAPYLSITDQTVKIYRDIFEKHFGVGYVLEHSSLARWRKMQTSAGDKDEVGEDKQLERSLSENWDAPIIITTSVQALESLHSNRPSDARKLHSLAQSVILFDEVQSLPQNLLLPTLKTLSRLASPQFGSSVVFATATQPAFSKFHELVQQNETNIGWAPTEIVPDSLNLFARASRVQVDWSHALQPLTHEAVAATLSDKKQALCIVNMRRDAQELSSLLRELCRDDEASLFHLSTFMCSAHRLNVLKEVRDRLKNGSECRLVSTQCIEAGTDVDFSFGMRALAPFSSIAQAAGRVNRNGLRELETLQVFDLFSEGQKYPDKAYEQGADVTKLMLAEYGEERLHLDDPHLFYDYYHKLYMLSQPDKANEPLKDAILRQDYVEVANLYKLINDDCVNVLVPYRLNGSLDAFDALSNEALDQGLSPQWMRKAQPLTISLYRSYLKSELGTRLQPIPLGKRKGGGNSDQWFIEMEKNNYDELTGFILEKGISASFG